MRKLFINLAVTCLSLIVSSSYAASYQSHASIHKAARLALQQHVSTLHAQQAEIKPGKLDSRLKLRRCSKALQASLPERSRGIGKLTVSVKCADSKPWSLHVPMQVSLYKDVLIAVRPLSRGDLLSADDVVLKRYDLANLPHGYLDNLEQSLGMKVKRQVSAGSALTPKMVEKPRIIQKGQRVSIIAQSGSMQVRTQGKALDDGVAGERIGIMNLKSKQKLEGMVTISGEVRVDI